MWAHRGVRPSVATRWRHSVERRASQRTALGVCQGGLKWQGLRCIMCMAAPNVGTSVLGETFAARRGHLGLKLALTTEAAIDDPELLRRSYGFARV